jgi:probable FeS assembly SUF system protein SufT
MFEQHEAVEFSRDCHAILVPDGTETTIAAGMQGRITQALGGSITVITQYGQMFRILGRDADAIGLDPSDFDGATKIEGGTIEDQVWAELATCYDPEIPVNIVDLGLVYHCKVETVGERHFADIKMTLTAPGCGMGDVLVAEVKDKVEALDGIDSAEVELVWEPQWSQSMMSEAARLQTGLM